jgi:hypothetical protein
MGRYLKNSSTSVGYAFRLPLAGTSGPEPSNLIDGMIRFNTSTNRVQYVYNNDWKDIASVGNVMIETQEEIGNNTSTNFTMTNAVANATDVMVFIGGVYQQPGVNYTISGPEIVFTSPPPAPDLPNSPNKIVIIYNFNSTDVKTDAL